MKWRGGHLGAAPQTPRGPWLEPSSFFVENVTKTLGGLFPLGGGEDWYAESVARMKGWTVEAFPEFEIFHHKKSGSARGWVKESFRQGVMDYSFGSYIFFEILKCFRRVREKPYIIGATIRFMGFLIACLKHEPRPVPIEVQSYLRKEQKQRVSLAIHSLCRL